MIVVVECGWEMLEPIFVRGWLDHMPVGDKSCLEMKICERLVLANVLRCQASNVPI